MELNLDTLPVKIANDVLEFVVSKLGISPTPQPEKKELFIINIILLFSIQNKIVHMFSKLSFVFSDLKKTEDAQKKKKQGKIDKMEIPLSINEKKELG